MANIVNFDPKWPRDLREQTRPEAEISVLSIVNRGKTGSMPLQVIADDDAEYWIKTQRNPHG